MCLKARGRSSGSGAAAARAGIAAFGGFLIAILTAGVGIALMSKFWRDVVSTAVVVAIFIAIAWVQEDLSALNIRVEDAKKDRMRDIETIQNQVETIQTQLDRILQHIENSRD